MELQRGAASFVSASCSTGVSRRILGGGKGILGV